MFVKARLLDLVLLCGFTSIAVAAPSEPGPSSDGSQVKAAAPYIPRGTPREENISDEEVRQIQIVIAEKLPSTILSIGPVTVGCGCAEPAGCTHQVILVTSGAKRSGQVTLDKVDGGWQLSDELQLQLRRQQFDEKMQLLPSIPAQDRKAYLEELRREMQLILTRTHYCSRAVKPAPTRKQ